VLVHVLWLSYDKEFTKVLIHFYFVGLVQRLSVAQSVRNVDLGISFPRRQRKYISLV